MISFSPARMAQTLALSGADKMNLDLCVGYLALIEMRRSSRGMVVVVGVYGVVIQSFTVTLYSTYYFDSR